MLFYNPKRSAVLLALLAGGCSAIDGLLNNDATLSIQKFSVSPKEVSAGTAATLAWNVEGADTVQIDNGVGVVQSKGSMEVRADRSKTYTLSASSGTSAASSTVQLVVTGTATTPSPTPSPTSTPTPSPSPTPTPTPAPTASPNSSCGLATMPECGRAQGPTGVYGCCWDDHARPLPSSPFDSVVDVEQDAIERERPGMFDRDGRVDEDAYVNELVRRLRARGLCATRGGPGDEVALKQSNAENYQYDVHLGNGRPRRSGYVSYCRPARF